MINIIVAVAQNGAIGCHNKLLWHISEDLQRFKRLTMGCPIIMGRLTFQSIGRPLPGRENIVISRQRGLEIEGCTVVNSLDEALERAGREGEVWVIGGGQIYEQALAVADRMYVTFVAQSPEGDTFFPPISASEWREAKREDFDGFSFVDYERKLSK